MDRAECTVAHQEREVAGEDRMAGDPVGDRATLSAFRRAGTYVERHWRAHWQSEVVTQYCDATSGCRSMNHMSIVDPVSWWLRPF